MNEPIIIVKNLGKKYNINHQRGGYVALRDILTNVAKHPFNFIKQKAKEAAGFSKKEEFWALQDVNFEVGSGEVVGIIGYNGAGKSTLLKILSQITPPTTGEIELKGRVGSLLEVGTGFHPELTGRENIMLNGAILGMPKKEIISKFDQIIEFAGIEKFLDTPVKYYSSGMYVRLAFSVAAHLEPDILIVDEVLAVGDAEFQKKCLGKMNEIVKTDGRTILFVSHNMAAISNLCNRTILLDKGRLIKDGPTEEIIKYYHEELSAKESQVPIRDVKRIPKASLRAKVVDIKILDKNGNDTDTILNGRDPVCIKLIIDSQLDDLSASVQIQVADEWQNLSYLDSTTTNEQYFILKKGLNEIECRISSLSLYAGEYHLNVYLTIPHQEVFDLIKDAKSFSVKMFDIHDNGISQEKNSWYGIFNINHLWKKL
ncbi:MAG: ABC transporter ATP-binding protein [Parcubacteria group bacterium]